ncbi:unnamed protein product [Meloidogyne enterolobii]|uniref:Uncharacterized protein n=1 Tax=Meloidogyne enterolobii TaxID=390850 RepID=A0ACB0YLR9_MELEN
MPFKCFCIQFWRLLGPFQPFWGGYYIFFRNSFQGSRFLVHYVYCLSYFNFLLAIF